MIDSTEPPDLLLDLTIGGPASEVSNLVCLDLRQMINSTEPPDLLLDLTIGGPASEVNYLVYQVLGQMINSTEPPDQGWASVLFKRTFLS